jgi:hypothetical protein
MPNKNRWGEIVRKFCPKKKKKRSFLVILCISKGFEERTNVSQIIIYMLGFFFTEVALKAGVMLNHHH